ncbi:MAG TPA: RDD family protein [Thermoanaerobaculia bacterium]|nr:RDD family protein [Thermoanaerobaculia bacterium]
MRRPDEESDEQLLFDLPLSGPEPKRSGAAERKRAPKPAPFAAEPPPPRPAPAPPPPDVEEEEEAEAVEGSAGVGRRFAAGAADLLVHAAMAVVVLGGTYLMGIRPALSDWPAVLAFLLSFSFLYTVVPLAFWGHTLGMVWANLTSRNQDGEPLTFDQTARRWLGGVMTTATLGLPLLFAQGGRSLSDLLSGSATYPGDMA